jgi:hypothetical protein
VQQLVTEQRGAGRWALARALCERWQWRASNGRLKTRSALAVLTELERRGCLCLPAPDPSSVHLKVAVVRPVKASNPSSPILDGTLSHYRPLYWELVVTVAQRRLWQDLLQEHHYLGAPELVGANLKYLVYGREGELLGALGWQSAVHHLGCRDRLLGWSTGFAFWYCPG